MKKEIINYQYISEELKIMKNCYEKLINGNDYDKQMALKIKEEIEYLEKELNPLGNVNTKE